MGIIQFFREFFSEMERGESKLSGVKKKKVRKSKKFIAKKKNKRYIIYFGIGFLILFLLAYLMRDTRQEGVFEYKCLDNHPCKDCEVVALCIGFEETGGPEHGVYFTIENRAERDVDCDAQLFIEKEGERLYNKTISLNTITALSRKKFKMSLVLPDKTSTVSVLPLCD